MSRPNAALIAEFYADVEVRGDLGEHDTCSRSRRPDGYWATDPRTAGATPDDGSIAEKQRIGVQAQHLRKVESADRQRCLNVYLVGWCGGVAEVA